MNDRYAELRSAAYSWKLNRGILKPRWERVTRPQELLALLNDYDDMCRMAAYETEVAQAAIEQVDQLHAALERLDKMMDNVKSAQFIYRQDWRPEWLVSALQLKADRVDTQGKQDGAAD